MCNSTKLIVQFVSYFKFESQSFAKKTYKPLVLCNLGLSLLAACTCPVQTCPTVQMTSLLTTTPCPTGASSVHTSRPPVICPNTTCPPCPNCTKPEIRTQTPPKCPTTVRQTPCPSPSAASSTTSTASLSSAPATEAGIQSSGAPPQKSKGMSPGKAPVNHVYPQ